MPRADRKRIWRSSTAEPIVADTLRSNHEEVAIKLFCAMARAGGLLPWAAIENVLRLHFGSNRTPTEQMLFKHYAAPIVRRIALLRHSCQLVSGNPRHIAILREALGELNAFDPEALRIVEMRFFARCKLKDIAAFYRKTVPGTFTGDAATYVLAPIDGFTLDIALAHVQSKIDLCKKLYRLTRRDKMEPSWTYSDARGSRTQ